MLLNKKSPALFRWSVHGNLDVTLTIVFCRGLRQHFDNTLTQLCQNFHKTKGQCIYEGKCNTAMVIYRITTKAVTASTKTQDSSKFRIATHITDVGKFWQAKNAFREYRNAQDPTTEQGIVRFVAQCTPILQEASK